MDEKLYKKLDDILDNLPSENAWVDYKLEFYDYKNLNKNAEIIKDICAFLNSIDGYGMDKFIIFGIQDKTLGRKGINKGKFPDDKDLVKFVKKISPRPSVFSGVYKYKDGNDYGYLCMPASLNDDRVYTVNTTYPTLTTAELLDPSTATKKNFVLEGIAYIRWNSTTDIVTEYDRRRIYDMKKKDIVINNIDSPTLNDLDKISVLKKIALIGSWNENNENDKKLVSEYLKMDYNAISTMLKSFLKIYPDLIIYESGIWSVSNKKNILVNYGDNYHKDDFQEYHDLLCEVYKTINTKYDLNKNQRMFSGFYDKGSKYSSNIRKSLIDTLLIINYRISSFNNIKTEINNLKYTIIDELIDITKWKSVASNFDIMSCLAEFTPEMFLEFADKLIENNDIKESLILESEEFITPINYLNNISDNVVLISRIPELCLDSLKTLIKYSEFDENIIDRIAVLLTPLHPQVDLEPEKRANILRKLYIENKGQTFKLLKKLLPSGISYTYDLPNFIYNAIPKTEEVTNKEYFNDEVLIIKTAFNYFDKNSEFLELFIKELFFTDDLLYQYIFENINNLISNKLPIKVKYNAFNYIKNELSFRKRVKSDDRFVEKSKDLETIISKLSLPDEIIYRRYFDINEWELEDEFDNENELNEYRTNIIAKIYESGGIDAILNFASAVLHPSLVGESLAKYYNLDALIQKSLSLMNNSNKKIVDFACGYLRIILIDKDDNYIIELCKKLTNAQKILVFLQLPNKLNNWKLMETLIKFPKNYWINNRIIISNDFETVDYAVTMKNKYKLYSQSLIIMFHAIYDKCDVNSKHIYDSLKGYLNNLDQTGISQYELNVIIEYLQNTNLSDDKKIEIEWIYLNVFDETHYPKTLQRKIVEEPEIVKELVHYAYKGKKEKKKELTKNEEMFANNAYKFLKHYLIVPGYDNDNKFNPKSFKKWIEVVLKNAKDDDREEITKHIIGEMLFKTLPDKNGLWIQEEVAELLNDKNNNDMRIGFKNAAFNSVGVVNCDGTGSAWLAKESEYLKKAEDLESKDYDLFAKALKNLAKSFKETANHEIERY